MRQRMQFDLHAPRPYSRGRHGQQLQPSGDWFLAVILVPVRKESLSC
jgi:hypothetical protein